MALAIVALLAGLGYPSYRAHLLRAHRTEAVEALLAAAAEQERFFLAHGRYAGAFASATGEPEAGLPVEPQSRGGRYRLALSLDPRGEYVASASPAAGRGQDEDRRCAQFSIHAGGLRTAVAADGSDSTRECWG